ncbi:hypothetical protein [Actimicrobium antarcticum]|uniref:hypothetical protein n=1 Tax=Actimicrobium antarcticum TaxID=1051899 RepID=UPI0031DF1D82
MLFPFISRSMSTRTTSNASVVLLVLAILFAQWLGEMHRIAHSGLASIPSTQEIHTSSIQQLVVHLGDPAHGCAAFDAATLADGINTCAFNLPVLPNLHVLALWIAFDSWSVPFQPNFHSRAPPSF